jgi:hypothetical protein
MSEKTAIRFYSPKMDLEVVVRPGYIDRHANGITYTVHEGKYVKFINGEALVASDDEESLKALRKSRLYGVEIFEDTQTKAKVVEPVAASVDPEKEALMRQIEELKAALASKGAEKDDDAEEVEDFNALKRRAKDLGIKGERDWKREDWERAITEKTGAQ